MFKYVWNGMLVATGLVLVGIVIIFATGGAGAPPPPGGDAPPPPPPPPVSSSGAIGPVGIIMDVGTDSSSYPLPSWYGRNLRVIELRGGAIVFAEREFPDDHFPIWVKDPLQSQWVTWQFAVICPPEVCTAGVGDIVDLVGIQQGDAFLATGMRFVMSSSP